MAKGAWIDFVKKVWKQNPGKSYGEAMKIASTLKNKGKMSMSMNMNKKGKKSKKTRKTKKSRK